MKKNRVSKNHIATIIPIAAIAVAIVAVGTVILLLNPFKSKETEAMGNTESPIPVYDSTKQSSNKENYITETNYKGELSQYPELYEIPFRKSDAYICNKDYSEGHEELFTECESMATSFYETLFNVDYRDIAANKNDFDAQVMNYCDYMAYHTTDFDTENEQTIYFFEYIQRITDYFIENQVEMSAKFYTDDSLVYSDFFTFVRGELVFTIFASEDKESEFEIGKEYRIPMEVAIQRTPSNPQTHTICTFGRADDTTYFINP